MFENYRPGGAANRRCGAYVHIFFILMTRPRTILTPEIPKTTPMQMITCHNPVPIIDITTISRRN